MSAPARRIIVIDASAGGLEAIDALIAQLPSDLRASIFIVHHVAPENTAVALLHRLGKYKAFDARLANDGEIFRTGRIYLAPSDYHAGEETNDSRHEGRAREPTAPRNRRDTLVSLRMFEERRNLLGTLLRDAKPGARRTYRERAAETERHIERIRAMLLASQEGLEEAPPMRRRSPRATSP